MSTAFCSVALPLRSTSARHYRIVRLFLRPTFTSPSPIYRNFHTGRPLHRVPCKFPFVDQSVPIHSCLQVANNSFSDARPLSSVSSSTPQTHAVSVEGLAPDAIDNMREQFLALPPDTDPDARRVGMAALITEAFPYPLDDFQTDALQALCADSSVVLSAPTGAGKTVIGEMAVFLALFQKRRVFYTTPLKALSNQKFYDFKKLFGPSRVGLLTGDVTVNRDADVVVMTTEVYRNMLYADAVEASNTPPPTDGLYAVVFDEFHYLNDRDRGTVWEESVISSPSHVLLVALSATMSNASDVREWFESVQGPTTLVESSVRPVPLRFAYCDNEGLTPLFAEIEDRDTRRAPTKGFGRRGRERGRESKKNDSSEKVKMHPKLLRSLKDRSSNSRSDRPGRDSERGDRRSRDGERLRSIANRNKRRDAYTAIPSFEYVVRILQRREMLPAIFFIFSRAGCDRAATYAANQRGSLVTEDERVEIQKRLDAFVSENPDLVQPERIELATKGLAAHHAALLPLWKVFVEELFQDGLVKVVFATETLAAGINMPARTTVISSLSKREGAQGFRDLTTSEVLQMAGRAGRRGKDVVGHSLMLRSRKEGALEAFKVVTSDVDALESKFAPTYGMVLNLLLTRSLDDSKRLVDRSFGNFLLQKHSTRETKAGHGKGNRWDVDIDVLRREKEALEVVLQEARETLISVDEAGLRAFVKAVERVRAEKRALAFLIEQSAEMDTDLIEDTLTFAPAGTRLLLRQRARPSIGAEKRQRRRDYAAAIQAAVEGDGGSDLRSFYLTAEEMDLKEVAEDDESTDGTMDVVEAILLDMHTENIGIGPGFLAVDVNGDLRFFAHSAVSGIFCDEEALNMGDISDTLREVEMPKRSEFRAVGYEQYVAPLPSELDQVAVVVREWHEKRVGMEGGKEVEGESESEGGWIGPSPKGKHIEEIETQRGRVEEAKQSARGESIYGREDIGMLLAARKAVLTIESTLDGTADPLGSKKKRKKGLQTAGRYAKLQESEEEGEGASSEEVDTAESQTSSWDEFMALVGVLQHYGFVDDEYAVTRVGEVGAKVRSENELWTSVVLLEPELEHVSPVHLGAILGATQMEGSRGDTFVDWELSTEVQDMLERLKPARTRMLAVQDSLGTEVSVGLGGELMGLVEMWATGATWVDLLRGTSLAEGDVCRIVRRTLDLLRQVVHLPMVSEGLRRNARRAISLLDRFPVTDDRTYWIGDMDKEPSE